MVQADYLGVALDRQARTHMLMDAVRFLGQKTREFDGIAFRGMSGALVGPALADRLGKHLMMVRKPADGSSHSAYPVEGERTDRYIIVDDFVQTGETVRAIVEALRKTWGLSMPLPVACYTFIPDGGTGREYIRAAERIEDYIPIWRPDREL